MGEENQYYIQEHHEPIISKEIFNLAQEIRKKKKEQKKKESN